MAGSIPSESANSITRRHFW